MLVLFVSTDMKAELCVLQFRPGFHVNVSGARYHQELERLTMSGSASNGITASRLVQSGLTEHGMVC